VSCAELAQVLAKVSAQRLIPVHNPDATTAEDAYKLPDSATKRDLKLLSIHSWVHAVTHPDSLIDFRGEAPSPQVDAFVHTMLGDLASGAVASESQKTSCKWLALFDAVRKVLQLRSGSFLAQSVSDQGMARSDMMRVVVGRPSAGGWGEWRSVQDAIRLGMNACTYSRARDFCHCNADDSEGGMTLDAIARSKGLESGQVVEHFLRKFGTLQDTAGGMHYSLTANQRHILVTTAAVCALQAGNGRLSRNQGKALLQALYPMQHKEVRSRQDHNAYVCNTSRRFVGHAKLMSCSPPYRCCLQVAGALREVGAVVKLANDGSQALQASLLTDQGKKTLAESLPALLSKRKAKRR
jgi:A49-like RNA polymerase I associated factor